MTVTLLDLAAMFNLPPNREVIDLLSVEDGLGWHLPRTLPSVPSSPNFVVLPVL